MRIYYNCLLRNSKIIVKEWLLGVSLQFAFIIYDQFIETRTSIPIFWYGYHNIKARSDEKFYLNYRTLFVEAKSEENY